MNNLPRVLQKEIWEYVHGDRNHYRQLFEQVMDQLDDIIEETERDLYAYGMPWKKANRLKFHSNTTKFSRSWDVKKYMKHLHQTGGLLFADSEQDLSQKSREWVEWFDREYPEFATTLIQFNQ